MPEKVTAGALTELYLALRGRLARSVAGIAPPKEIEDIVQEAYVRVCQVDEAAEIRAPRAYLYRAVRNLALDHAKCAETRLSDSLEDLEAAGGHAGALVDSTFHEVASNEEFSIFCDAVRHLPVQCRRAFVLRKVYGCTQREIAAELGLSESTVEKHIALGMKRCLYFMEQFDRNAGGSATGKPPRRARKA